MGPGSPLDRYLSLFRRDSDGLKWAEAISRVPDAPAVVRAFADGGPALPAVWNWLRERRERAVSARKGVKRRAPLPKYASQSRAAGNVLEL